MRSILMPLLLISLLLLTQGVIAGENKIPREGTVFTGEENLDIADCNVRTGDEIAWWRSGSPQGPPDARARVMDVTKFTIDPSIFSANTGTWYGLMNHKPIFTVEDPWIQLDVVENGLDTNPDWVKRGNLVSFRIATNLYLLSKRSGCAGVPVTVNMTGPSNKEYHSIPSSVSGPFNLDQIYVYYSPYDTGAIWDTQDEKEFPDGAYTFSAGFNVNNIAKTQPGLGVTYTPEKTITLSKREPGKDDQEVGSNASASEKNLSSSKNLSFSEESTYKNESAKATKTPTPTPKEIRTQMPIPTKSEPIPTIYVSSTIDIENYTPDTPVTSYPTPTPLPRPPTAEATKAPTSPTPKPQPLPLTLSLTALAFTCFYLKKRQ